MGQVTITLNGRAYRLQCGDGEEDRLRELAAVVGQRVDQLGMQFGQYGDERLLLMAALLITDDMLDLKSRLDELESRLWAQPDAAAPQMQPSAYNDAHSLDNSAGPSIPLELSEAPTATVAESAVDTTAAEAPLEPEPPRAQPMLRRGSLEARLAQARTSAPPKTGT